MIRQHVGGGKSAFDPKLEPLVLEKISKRMDDELDNLIVDILDAKKASPAIVAMEQDLGDDQNPNEYHLFLAFPPSKDGKEISEVGDIATPAAPALFRRVRVPLIEFCEKLAKAFEGQMTSTTLCFVADASCGLGSEVLTTVVKECGYGVVSWTDYSYLRQCFFTNSKEYF